MMTAYYACLAVDVNRVHGSKWHPSFSGRFFRLKPNLSRDDIDVDWTMGFIAIITNNVAGWICQDYWSGDTGHCEGNSPVAGEFPPAQRAINAENVSIWWRHRDTLGNVYTS